VSRRSLFSRLLSAPTPAPDARCGHTDSPAAAQWGLRQLGVSQAGSAQWAVTEFGQKQLKSWKTGILRGAAGAAVDGKFMRLRWRAAASRAEPRAVAGLGRQIVDDGPVDLILSSGIHPND